MIEWHTRKDESDYPIESGLYRVVISGDSEYLDGHCIYSFDDYETWAEYTADEDGGSFSCMYDEENISIVAFYGPITIPKYEVKP
jgi:hypothetical protein